MTVFSFNEGRGKLQTGLTCHHKFNSDALHLISTCIQDNIAQLIDHFTVLCSVTWPLNGSEAGGDLVLIQTSLFLLCKSSCSNAN